MSVREIVSDWWFIDPEAPDAASRFFWRVLRITWFCTWLVLQYPAKHCRSVETDHGTRQLCARFESVRQIRKGPTEVNRWGLSAAIPLLPARAPSVHEVAARR